jgi:hypothetical protein
VGRHYGSGLRVAGAALLGLFGWGARAQNSGTIEGTAYAPAGQTVADVVVVACLPKGDGCDENATYSVTLRGGSSAAFKLSGLKAGQYALIAYKDVNDDEDLGDGDLLGAYVVKGDEEMTLVKPPAQGLEIRLAVQGQVSGPATPPAPASTPSSAPAVSTPQQGEAKPAAGQVYGWAIDRKDNPLPGARIVVSGTGYSPLGILTDKTFTATSDKNGNYAINLLADSGGDASCSMTYSASLGMYTSAGSCRTTARSNWKWTAQGYVDVKYNGREYCLPMDGTSFESFTSEGAERGWAYPEQSYAQLNPTLWVEGIASRKEYEIKVRLVPDGPLWNGTKGQTVEFKWKTDYVDRGVAVFGWQRDIPLGRYKLAISLIEPDGKERPLKVAPVLDRAGGSPWSAKEGTYGDTVEVNFDQPRCSEMPLMAVSLRAR